MALYSFSVRYFSRGKGTAIVASAAYRSGEKLYDRYYGWTHDYTHKRGIVHTEILLPPNAPPEFVDRATLWNAVEYAEKRRDSQLAREVRVALEREFSLLEQKVLLQRYVTANFLEKGMIADVSIHDRKDGNPHAHILLTTRPVNREGFDKKKNREWDNFRNASVWRREWANILNREFKRKGLEIELSHERCTDREATLHLGHRVTELERRGIQTDRSNMNRAIVEKNKREAEHKKLEREFVRQYEREQNRERGR